MKLVQASGPEKQFRESFLDSLLEELKDSGTELLKECQCLVRSYRRSKDSRAIADYFVRIHGNWIPVEAKAKKLSELVLEQVALYTCVRWFKPTQGDHKE